MDSSDVIRKKVDNDDGTLTLVFYQGAVEVARTIVDRNYEIINLQGAIPDGMVRQYYDSGTLFTEATYKNNRREGLTCIYRENGPLWIEIPFKDDKAEGISKEFYPDGKLFKATSFRNMLPFSITSGSWLKRPISRCGAKKNNSAITVITPTARRSASLWLIRARRSLPAPSDCPISVAAAIPMPTPGMKESDSIERPIWCAA